MTDQESGAPGEETEQSRDGLDYRAGKFCAVRVIFLHENALPATLESGLPTAPFYVHGPKVADSSSDKSDLSPPASPL